MYLIALLFIALLTACSSADDGSRRRNQVASYIDRHHDEYLFSPKKPTWQVPERHPWELQDKGKYPYITKEYFRCRGCELNPTREDCIDCGGSDRHGLPLHDGKEFIYPVLVDLLNYIQEKTDKRVVITSGHRCPEHNRYIDASPANSTSKHQIGAEVSFYVHGLEDKPEIVAQYIFQYYQDQSKYAADKSFQEFLRYEKETDVRTLPWYNKEVFVKLYQRDEGRDLDNRHPYAYVSVQVRYDWDKKERVQYSWKEARNYMRY